MDLNASESKTDPKGYYALFINYHELSAEDKGYKKLYENAHEMLPLTKKYKTARFKYFDDWESAQNFALNGCKGDSEWSADAFYTEKWVNLLAPKSVSKHEFIEFRKYIEDGNAEKVQTLIAENPRYLVGPSAGAFPSILKEGPRYNALHVAAKAKSAEITSCILKAVSDPVTFEILYGKEANEKSNVKGAQLLLDMYLNTPDKTLQETPLHFASKHAATGVVEVLVSYPECQKDRPNKYDQTPLDIIGSREDNVPPEEIERIRLLLTDPFYVPVLRSEDNSCQPIIGEPFSPTSPVYQRESDDIVSPKLEIKAVAGPMAFSQAFMFKKQWKTPPRNFQPPSSPLSTRLHHVLSPGSPVAALSPARRIILADPDRGLEKVGRCLAKEKNIGWKEYWPFLEDFADLQSEKGLEKLEVFLREKFLRSLAHQKRAKLTTFKKRWLWKKSTNKDISSKDNSDSSGSESGGKEDGQDIALSHSQVDLSLNLNDKIAELCAKLEKLKIKSPRSTSESIKPENESFCSNISDASLPHSTQMPYLCIEKSCQVFAKRIGDIFLGHHSNNNVKGSQSENTLKSYLMQEMKHFNTLIEGYMNDSAFESVKFSQLHHRLALRIANYLLSQSDRVGEISEDLCQLIKEKEVCINGVTDNCTTPPSRNSSSRLREEAVLYCIIQQCYDVLSSPVLNSSGDGFPLSNCSLTGEGEVQSQWESSANCCCNFVNNFHSLPKRYRNRMRNSVSYRRNRTLIPWILEKDSKPAPAVNGFQQDSSDSEEEWHDSLSAPEFEVDPQNADELVIPFRLTEAAPELYINRYRPSKLDLDVLEAIGDTKLDLVKYPMTNYWKNCVLSHPSEVRERWDNLNR